MHKENESNLKQISLPDGRKIAYSMFGDHGGVPIFYFHGFPASRLEAEIYDGVAKQLGICIVAPDRPGIGYSDFELSRKILDWPKDIAYLADAMGLNRFSILGGSAGCPYALACGARLAKRVAGVVIVAGLGPLTEKSLIKEMGAMARIAFVLSRHAQWAFKATVTTLGHLIAKNPELNYHLNEATKPDREELSRPDIRSILNSSVQEAFRQGTAGAAHELNLLVQPWNFKLEEVLTPVHIWHGCEDRVVPLLSAELLAKKVPHGELHLVPGEGHISLPIRYGTRVLRSVI